jgi:hypothetical protein
VHELAEACGQYRVFVLTAAYTGLRWGELRTLRVKRIDLERGRIDVAEAMPERSLELDTPKNHKRRTPGRSATPYLTILATLSAEQVSRLLDGSTADALNLAVPLDADRPGDSSLPDDLRLANGTSAYQAPGGRLYATPDHLDHERLLAAAAVDRDAPTIPVVAANGFIANLADQGIELGADQAAAVRGVLTSGARVETLVGPAGTGKSFVVGVFAKAWQDAALWPGESRLAVGLAASQIATEILGDEGLDTRNIARWLATQDRLATYTAKGDDQRWRQRSGDLVVVDESAMADTPQPGPHPCPVSHGRGETATHR